MESYQKLEQEWAHWNGLDPEKVVCCSSGTAALHLALEALQLPPGTRVAVPNFTMVACARAVTLAGLQPIFMDCDPIRFLSGPEEIRKAVCYFPNAAETDPGVFTGVCDEQNQARVIMPVHVYGRQVDLESAWKWIDLATPKDGTIYVIEDLAEAHGLRPHEKSDAACWSFYKNKIVAGEEGGAVYFRDVHRANLARSLRSLGFTEAHDFDHIPRGHNYRMSNCHAEIIRRSLELASVRLYQRRVTEQHYQEIVPAAWKLPFRDVVWVYDLQLPGLERVNLLSIVKHLQQAGIPARASFLPLSRQIEYRDKSKDENAVVNRAANTVMYLPVAPTSSGEAYTESQCQEILQVLSDAVQQIV